MPTGSDLRRLFVGDGTQASAPNHDSQVREIDTHTLSLFLSLFFTRRESGRTGQRARTHTHSHTHSHTFTHIHSLTRTFTLTHTPIHLHTFTHTHTFFHLEGGGATEGGTHTHPLTYIHTHTSQKEGGPGAGAGSGPAHVPSLKDVEREAEKLQREIRAMVRERDVVCVCV